MIARFKVKMLNKDNTLCSLLTTHSIDSTNKALILHYISSSSLKTVTLWNYRMTNSVWFSTQTDTAVHHDSVPRAAE